MTDDMTRNSTMSRMGQMLNYISEREAKFNKHDLAADLEIGDRQAARYLEHAVVLGWVAHAGEYTHTQRVWFKPKIRIEVRE